MQAAALLPDALGCRLVLAGELSPPDLAWRTWPGHERVELRGWQDRAGVLAALGQARVGLVLLHPTPEYRESWPVKLFEYMAAGLPIVASDFPLWRSFVEGAGCGFLVDPLDPQAIASAAERLLTRPDEAAAMGARGWRAARERFSWESEAKPLLALYERLAAARR
ncbi:MAG: glycosyltransferase [Comamonadaceae bacterium]|nr:glycosyltransferase [Comamonadaceae bacterium]